MTILGNNVVARVTGGVLFNSSLSTTPTINTIVDAGTGVSAVVNVTASGTVQLYYCRRGSLSWTTGLTRSGSGNITQTGLTPGWYDFYATDTVGGVISGPSVTKSCRVEAVPAASTTINEFDQDVINTVAEILAAMGEPITYLPLGGDSRSILAIVDRDGQSGLPGMQGNAPSTTITVANSATTGISSTEIDFGGDKVTIEIRRGTSPANHKIVRPISQDAGMLTLEVR